MAAVSPLAEFLGQAIYQFEMIKPLLPTYGHLLLSALFPIYIGSHASLSRPSSAAKSSKSRKKEHESSSEEENEDEGGGPIQKMEGLEPSDALMFPLMAGLTLGGLYLVIKWLEDPAILNKILSFYFSQMGLFFAVAFLKDSLLVGRSFLFPSRHKYAGKIWKVKQSQHVFVSAGEVRQSPLPGFLSALPLPKLVREVLWACRGIAYQKATFRLRVWRAIDIKCRFGILDILSGFAALCAVGYFAFVTKPWWLTNFLGFSFCYGALQFMSPSTFWTGTLILGSLFLYDIYFVFFTPLMVTVATKLDVPIKLLFPRPPAEGAAPDVVSLAMLGLGDIVVPGMMVGLALRFDLFLYYKKKGMQIAKAAGAGATFIKPRYQTATGGWGERFWACQRKSTQDVELAPPYHDAQSFPKIYFYASVIGYIVGMVATLLVMQYANHAQPALLYLVPGVLISLWGTALFRGEIDAMWNFSDAEEEDTEDTKTRENKEADEQKEKASKGSLFSRLLSGDIKAFSEDSETTTESASETKVQPSIPDKSTELPEGPSSGSTRKSSEEGDKDDKSDELILFSITLPSRGSSRQAGDPKTKAEAKQQDSIAAAPRDGEPPAKRVRRSPRGQQS
ncbi:signal peptide peptidase, putative [Paecilomyces variotii No. 5]|uniref:Signal peptide peptidase, putative n=1 Tax=Byssochlamys spectabilis (strain No. 5 / NBRC 109023) TaxID=1356009 RepID=V5G0J5_BYSSN|nr:signal peptide peptidase, putative [Paecilomyces variotii No. 5]